jgi:hypothetical protein
MPEAKPHAPSWLKAALLGLGIFAVMYFMIIAINTRDLLWFWPKFQEVPVEIIVHCYGTDVEIRPGEPAFEAVTNAVNTSLSGSKRWDQTTLSDATYQEYQTSPSVMVLELHYDPPATVHSQYAFMKSANWLVIPLDGRHASNNAVFGLINKYIEPGAYFVKSTAPIVTALQEQDVCSQP